MASPPQKLSPIHMQMCALNAAGYKEGEIASLTGYTRQQVTNVLAHPDAGTIVSKMTTDFITRLTDDVGQIIQGAAREAALKNIHLMRNGENDAIKQRSAFDILDRAGFKPKEISFTADLKLPAREAELITSTLEHMGREIIQRPPLDNAVEVLTKEKQKEEAA